MSAKKKPAKAKAPKKAKAAKPEKAKAEKKTGKGDMVLSMLRKPEGASHAEMQEATGWLPHTLRAFISRQVRKVLGHSIIMEQDKEGVKRYRIKSEK